MKIQIIHKLFILYSTSKNTENTVKKAPAPIPRDGSLLRNNTSKKYWKWGISGMILGYLTTGNGVWGADTPKLALDLGVNIPEIRKTPKTGSKTGRKKVPYPRLNRLKTQESQFQA